MGKLSIPKVNETYVAGQFFLHRIFGYRGVVLFPWRVKVYERNPYYPNFTESITQSNATSTPSISDEPSNSKPILDKGQTTPDDSSTLSRRGDKKEAAVNFQTYYQVLIDSRDCPHVVSWSIIFGEFYSICHLIDFLISFLFEILTSFFV